MSFKPPDIDLLMRCLSDTRQIFHSEADFQHALAWKIHESIPDCDICLERPFSEDETENERIHIDIWCRTLKVAIELKYYTRSLKYLSADEQFALKNQGAQPTKRYDFLKDIQRLEQLIKKDKAKYGFAVLLTNDPSYWKTPAQKWEETKDAKFRLHEGRKVKVTCKNSKLAWKSDTGEGTKKGRECPIEIKMGPYELGWRCYSELKGDKKEDNRQFRYLAVKIP